MSEEKETAAFARWSDEPHLRDRRRTFAWVTGAISFAALLVFLPATVAFVLGSWVALITQPWMRFFALKLGGPTRAAAVITTLVIVGALGPVLAALIPIAISAIALASDMGKSNQWHDAAQSILGGTEPHLDFIQFVRAHAADALNASSRILNIAGSFLFGLAMFVVSLFAFLLEGKRTAAWLREHSPLHPIHFDRMAAAYVESGRALLIGVGTTAIIQGAIAAITYICIGVPRALALGLLTTIGSLIPGIGTTLIWGPVTIILALGGYPVKAAIVAVSGAVIIGSVDNVLKPILARRAKLKLPAILVFIASLSGIVALGPSGLLLGPLFVRLAIEALEIARELRLVGAPPGPPIDISPTGVVTSDGKQPTTPSTDT